MDQETLRIERDSISNLDLEQCLKKPGFRGLGGCLHSLQKRHGLIRSCVFGRRLGTERAKTGEHHNITVGRDVRKQADQPIVVNSLDSQYTEIGVPGLYRGFEKEVLRRTELVSDDSFSGSTASVLEAWALRQVGLVDVDDRHEIQVMIGLEERGKVPLKKPLGAWSLLIELPLLGVFGVGLPIGLAAFALRWRRGKSQQEEAGKNM